MAFVAAIAAACDVQWPFGFAARVRLGPAQQITNALGQELDPAISPDGLMLAYASGRLDGLHVQVRDLATGRTIDVTDLPGSHRRPTWAPDGKRLAFMSTDSAWSSYGGTTNSYSLHAVSVPFDGRVERLAGPVPGLIKIADPAWSPDGRHIAYADESVIVILALDDAKDTTRSIDVGPNVGGAGAYFVHSLAWSPDGEFLAYEAGNPGFVFGPGDPSPRSLWIVPAGGGAPRRVVGPDHLNLSPVWRSNRSLLFVSDRDGPRDIFALPLDRRRRPSGPPKRLTTGLNAYALSVDAARSHLVFSTVPDRSRVLTMTAPADRIATLKNARPLAIENTAIRSWDLSPDGRWLAFDSRWRGVQVIYRVPASGGEPQPLTNDSADSYGPAWSPDGRDIAFYALHHGEADVFLMSASGDSLRRVTQSPAHERFPAWSPDGKTLVYSSDAGGANELYAVERQRRGAPFGPPRRITSQGDTIAPALRAAFSPNGEFLAYSRGNDLQILELATDSSHTVAGASTAVSLGVQPWWSPDSRFFYFLVPELNSVFSVDAVGPPWAVVSGRVVPAGRRIGGEIKKRVWGGDRYISGLAARGRRLFVLVPDGESDIWICDLGR